MPHPAAFAEHLGHELRVRGFESLPHRLGSGENGYLAVCVDLDVDRLGRQRAGPLEIDR